MVDIYLIWSHNYLLPGCLTFPKIQVLFILSFLLGFFSLTTLGFLYFELFFRWNRNIFLWVIDTESFYDGQFKYKGAENKLE